MVPGSPYLSQAQHAVPCRWRRYKKLTDAADLEDEGSEEPRLRQNFSVIPDKLLDSFGMTLNMGRMGTYPTYYDCIELHCFRFMFSLYSIYMQLNYVQLTLLRICRDTNGWCCQHDFQSHLKWWPPCDKHDSKGELEPTNGMCPVNVSCSEATFI